MESAATVWILSGSFLITLLVGAISAHTRFCTMGAVSDWLNIGSSTRLQAWLLAMLSAVFGVALLEALGYLNTRQSWLPYLSPQFAWPRYLLGGLLFGIGMTLAGGCVMRNLIRVGGGNLKALVVLVVVAISAWALMHTTLYGDLFAPTVMALTVDLGKLGLADQHLLSLLGPAHPGGWIRFTLIAVLVLAGLFGIRRFGPGLPWLSGLTVGLGVVAGWALTASPLGKTWLEDAHFQTEIPPAVGLQSHTFVSPMGSLVRLIGNGFEFNLMTFGIAGAAGLVLGSLLLHLLTRQMRLEWFPSWTDLVRHLIGALMMGMGGVLALGCTVGQGVTGVSTLSVGSLLATAAIILGASLSLKLGLYRMVYPEAGFSRHLAATLADLHLVPARWRCLERVE